LNRSYGFTGVVVRRSNGARFLENEWWTKDTLVGASAVLFGDVTGDGMADLVAIKADGSYMLRSNRWFFGGLERLSDQAFSPSRSIPGDVFAVTDLTGDRRADLVQVNDDAVWANLTVDRRIPIRFVQLVVDPGSALAQQRLEAAMEAANAVYRPAGVQFFLRASEVVTSAALSDLSGSGSASPGDLAAAKNGFNPACDIGNDLAGLSSSAQLSVVATRCAMNGEILVYVARIGSSTALLPWEGKGFFMDPADLMPEHSPFRFAHELGHYLGLPHVFGCCGNGPLSRPDLVPGNLKNPATGGSAPLSLFWDLVYAPKDMTNIMFDNAADAAAYESSLVPIQQTGTTVDPGSGWYCPSADPTRTCDPMARPGTICLQLSAPSGKTQKYCSGDRDLKGLALPLSDDSPTVNVMSLGYRLPMPDPSDVAHREPTLSLSQIEQIRRTLGTDIATPILGTNGQPISGGRPQLGL
jgi:hypothetical protein